MKRRELIKLMTLATGAVLSVPLSSSLLTACKKVKHVKDSDYTLQFFNDQEFSFVKNLLEIILPKTNSPSAIDVGVHQIIDTMIGTVYSPDQQNTFTEMFTDLTQYMDSDNLSNKVQRLLKSEKEKDKLAKSSLIDIKQQVVAYYLSTEEIATNFLNYLPVPGVYESCITLESVDGKAWAI
jgi:spore maturation protein CgeB